MMAFDEGLAHRVEELIADYDGFEAKKMFGGMGYLLYGNMACGLLNENLIVRVGKDAHDEAMGQPHTRPFDITGRTMKGWVMVTVEGYEDDADLKDWVSKGVNFSLTLPPK
jgi:TfoX/Sxy family transcriptional regulator of competence genes